MNTESITQSIIDSGRSDELIESIVESAYQIYLNAGCESDFGLQFVSPTSLVFGRTNRVIWTAKRGLQPDHTYCTKLFLEKWAEQ